MALSEDSLGRLALWLGPALGAGTVAIERCERLGGGAIQENLGLDLAVADGPRAGRHAVVLRTDAASGVAASWDRVQEYRILKTAHEAGVLVPEPWCVCEDPAVIGARFYVMRRHHGEARGIRLVRDAPTIARGDEVVAFLAGELAKLHRVRPPQPLLGFVPVPAGDPIRHRVDELRRFLDLLDQPQPVLEWGLRWLERHAPASDRVRFIHNDFRTGNYLVHDGRVDAVLDWEFAAFGEPLEDLGWFLARCWRFGCWHREAGGIGSREALLAAYEAASGAPVDRRQVRFAELLATLRWAVIALQQAERHFSGREPSLELALTAHVVPTLELDTLAYVAELEGHPAPRLPPTGPGTAAAADPTAGLLKIARETARAKIGPPGSTAERYTMAMVRNAMAIAARAVAARDGAIAAEARGLGRLQSDSLRSLASEIRAGSFDRRAAELAEACLLPRTAWRLAVSNPAYADELGDARP